MKLLWPDTFVEESNLAQHVFQLRKALGDRAQDLYRYRTRPRVSVRRGREDRPRRVAEDSEQFSFHNPTLNCPVLAPWPSAVPPEIPA